jgi:glycerol-3-phosphate acyltransferase PlsX
MQNLIWIVLDTKGGDLGASEMLRGAVKALEAHPQLGIVLSGDRAFLEEECQKAAMPMDRIEIVEATEEITNYDSAADALFRKTASSMLRGLETLGQREDLFGMISAGNTGVLLTGAMRYLAGKERVRPALAAVLPSQNGGFTCLVDTGATIDCTSQILQPFAHLGVKFLKETYVI